MIKIVAIVLLVAILAVLGVAATRPDSFRVERSTTIAAPPDRVYALISDLRQFNTWNPFQRKEPTAKLTYTGPSAGIGAAYTWDGDKSGAGRMEIVEALPAQRVGARLDFMRPMEAHNRVEFSLQPHSGGGTRVTWAMTGPMPYVFKLFTLFSDMDTMVGSDFSAGLDNLKQIAEKS
jgi:uncharacterized protein YndB with AHSA1/START domain